MNRPHTSVSRSRRGQRWLPPATAAGAGGTALVIWFEELIVLAAEFIGVIFLLVLSVPIFLFNHLVIKSAMTRPDDKREK
jgi:hypothetical protein